MQVKTKINKENNVIVTIKKGATLDGDLLHKGREFGTEITNNTGASSECEIDEKSPCVVRDNSYESNVPKTSPKTHKMTDLHAGTSITLRWKREQEVPSQYKGGKDLTKLEGEDLKEALKEELKLRRKAINKDISFHDVINFRTPELVGEYAGKWIQWMREQEEEFRIKNNYLDTPPLKKNSKKHKLTREDRAIVVDLVFEIHRKYGLVPETLFVAISTIDRYLSMRKEPLRKSRDIESIGVAALLIASKYEDIYPPALDEMITMMGRPSTRKEVLNWEFKILKQLVFQITVPTPFRFLERFSSVSVVYQNAAPLAQYLIELALYDFDIVYNLSPSEIAWVALFAAVNFDIHTNKISPKLKWSSEIIEESSMRKGKIIEYFNTYFIDLAFRVERELKVNDINIKYPQYQFVDDEPLGLFSQIK